MENDYLIELALIHALPLVCKGKLGRLQREITMTHIANLQKYPTKKAFKEAVNADPSKVYLEDPSIFSPVSGYVSEIMKQKDLITVTNHPKRSWFAQIVMKNGKIVVS